MRAPKNMGMMAGASAIGTSGNEGGPFLRLYLLVSQDKHVERASFETYVCPASMAAGSVLTEMLKGLALQDAIRITPEDLDKVLGGMPPSKKFCVGLAVQALRKAIVAWANQPE